MNAGKFFLDTNIFVCTFEERHSAKRDRARQLVAQALETRLGIISYQVVQEFLNVTTRKFAKPMSVSDAQLYLARILMPLCEVFPDAALYSQALSISGEMGIGFYDALIVSSAIGADAVMLWSEDLQHGRRIRSLEIRDPFRG